MPLAKVWNKNFLPFSQDFDGEKIYIEANHYIIMDQEKGRNFAAKYFPIKVDAGGRQMPESYKMIEVEMIGSKEEIELTNKLRCQACSFVGNDKADLDEHVTERHLDSMIDKEEREKRLKKR